MEFLLKSSAIIFIFYLCYRLFLQRETFFVGNRWFLLGGILCCALIPFIVIPVYVEYSVPFETIATSTNTSHSLVVEESSFDFYQFIIWIYAGGLLFFSGKLVTEFIALFILIRKHHAFSADAFHYIETTTDLAPFSFFKWIVYNPNQFDSKEMALVINHEKVHAKQYHSIDIIVVQLACAVFWFNPLMWFYKKALQQNLEFIADQEAQIIAPSEKAYQNLLLKSSIPNHQLALTNNFYNSLIKKRIVMLHKTKSNNMNRYKYALVLPLLVLFVFNFNTEIIAQTKGSKTEKIEIGQNVLRFVITKDTKDKQLESIKENLAEKDATVVFENLERNDRHELTGIKINYTHEGKKGNFFVSSDDPIEDITISLNVNENKMSVGQAMKQLSQSFEVITKDGQKKVMTSGSGSNVFVYSTDDDDEDDEKVIVRGKDGETHEVKKEKNVYVFRSSSVLDSDEPEEVVFIKKNNKDSVWVKKDVKNMVWTTDANGKDVQIETIKKGDNKIMVFSSEGGNPLYMLDGKEITKKEFEAIDAENIEKMEVYKGDEAIEKYGKKAKDGVILITTKKKN